MTKQARSKYIIIKHNGEEVPMVFSALLSHKLIAGETTVVAAGFCRLDTAGRWAVSGRSDSLELTARPQDAEILNKLLCL